MYLYCKYGLRSVWHVLTAIYQQYKNSPVTYYLGLMIPDTIDLSAVHVLTFVLY